MAAAVAAAVVSTTTLAGCGPSPAASPAGTRGLVVETPAPPPHAPSSTPSEAAVRSTSPLDPERAVALADAWRAVRSKRPDDEAAEARAAFDRTHGIDEATVARVLEALTRSCLAARSHDDAACSGLGPTSRTDPRIATVLDLAGEVADTRPGRSALLSLLVRLDARGAWRADMAIERALERRMNEGRGRCAPPGSDEIEAARAGLAGVEVRDPGGPPRAATEAERADLAYFDAALRHAGDAVGTAREDDASPALPDGSPELARRQALRDAMREALLDGDLARHAEASQTYLAALGYPGPIRAAEESDRRWGGAGFSYAMRQWARSAEILGRYEVAEPLHRRAAPGGGMCGTSTPSVLAEQTEGVIRAAELRRGCGTIVAERLFVPGGDDGDAYGTERLTRAGFDVARLYRAALLDVVGRPDWSTRVRAVSGYADVAGRDAVPRLVDMAERGDVARRVASLHALEALLRSHGLDPCKPSNVGFGFGTGSGDRRVRSIMTSCDRKLDDVALGAVVRRIAALAADPAWEVREAVARTLAATASPSARAPLQRLARDAYDDGGTVCTSTDGGPQRCERNLPVRRAATEGLTALTEAAEVRREQAASSRSTP